MSRKRHDVLQTPLTPEIAFGQVLRQRRTALGLTQTALEADSRVDRSYISQLENGNRQPCLKTIIQLAFKLNMQPGQLLDEVVSRIDPQELEKLR